MIPARRSNGKHVDTDYCDPHLYYGVAVDVMEQALPDPPGQYRRYARYWCQSGQPGKVWIIVYHHRVDNVFFGEAVLVPAWGVHVSQRPAEPPPMPEWAVWA